MSKSNQFLFDLRFQLLPSGYGLLYKKSERDRSLHPSSNPPVIQRSPRMYMTHNDYARGSNFDSAKSLTPVENYSDRFPIALRNNTNQTGKSLVWVSPSPRSANMTLSDQRLDSFPLTVRNRTNNGERNLVWIRTSSRLESARTVTESDISLNSSLSTLRQNAQKFGENIVRVHPSR